ncbi:DNA excision repair protein ERCC-2 [Halorientalis persicus]|uniref:DNA excision repair protein ERCC-2 n=1 Tax=Halorientalis persicus TaxID=1367881 RepID=A0A1H8ELY4_9EURY|nr:ATP-dependent DNA helicase [Halorientalis persicus]SEN20505.1 DNA excision repair protein ERCC-2 [Halorientalis persicus]
MSDREGTGTETGSVSATAESDGDGDDAEDPPWRPYFGYDVPYENQPDAVEAAIEVGRKNGYLAMEGPCGTGKTMAALTAATTLVREDDYEHVVVVTPVKQQLDQFVEDLRVVNSGLDDPLDGIALVGKRDLCPYGREDLFPRDASVHDRCEDLREDTARLVEADGGTDGHSGAAADAAVGGDVDGEDQWWDPKRGADLAKAARRDPEQFNTMADDRLETAGVESPYRREQPRAPEEMADGDDPPLYCPFEADWYARDKGSPVDFSDGEDNVLTSEEFLPESVAHGTCPHRAMGVLLGEADVVIGNYNHLFDPDSRPLLSQVLDESTFVIVDEAHRLEGRVRDLLSDRVGRHTLVRARNDCNQLLQLRGQSRDHEREVDDRLASHDVPAAAVEAARDFYDDVVGWLDERVTTHLDSEFGRGWEQDLRSLPEEDMEVPLRDPETEEIDDLTEWAEREGYGGDLWRSLAAVGTAVETTLDELGESRQCVAAAVGAVMGNWYERDHATAFREIELEHSPSETGATATPWQEVYTAGLLLYDCMPAQALRTIFDELGGGVLMSATLEPLDVFTRVSGLDALERSGTGGLAASEDDPGRPVETRSYGLTFPEENRASWLVDATAYTARNRGDPVRDHGNRTRDEYEQVLRTVARSPGNVMIAMPNYREAAWAGSYLRDVVEKDVLVDESSSNEATDDLKREFFAGPGKVLVTSTRGTLTEGVDYDGDKLHACAVVGVPLVNIGSPRVRAVQAAYGRAFGDDVAFEYALTVPAVRRARQAIGRVIRGADEVGVRMLVGERYTEDAVHSVHEYLSPAERSEFVRMTPDFLGPQFDSFWRDHDVPE